MLPRRHSASGALQSGKPAWFIGIGLLAMACGIPSGLAWSAPAPTVGTAKPAPTGPAAKPAPKSKDHVIVYHLLGFNLRGTKRVNTDALVDALPQHAGDKITDADIKADADSLGRALKARHVHGELTTVYLEREGGGHYIWVLWDLQKIDALSYAPRRGKLHLDSQSFVGNTKLDAAKLALATGLHPGDPLPDGSLSDARTGIEQAYDPILHGASVDARAKAKIKKDNGVVVEWDITEPK